MKTKHISLDEVIAIHDNMVSLYGGSHGIRDLGLVESAISRPKATFGEKDLYPDIFSKAAALFHSLMFNHAFVDGNKRTTITTAARFLNLNGYELKATDREFVDFPLRVENNHLSFEEIAKWLEKHSQKTP
ncbi:MAG: type II toxin-antitoxin system death-on-curing family toxin [Candidatus Levybacteria bacterium CG_4_10_14_0_2_um_filter_36_16]|nr:MAG: type II toxin-antitoxin system death-on-curing family toxin [Candidatus Levybacteria bacterium CG_4_10_14_0_2_um_filter_36_16]PJA90674.1 MAG: type II toxin-antitoxin system death-on-curing family toxin [Candidatus Levybacteria bacterium CG_4_9_14_3_um_filter_36_7]